ncbi:MAG: acetylxylan esterase, partial [Planctomycetales bacterium]|nr:acetylxylan esterase [Planctomycetales bacterium]
MRAFRKDRQRWFSQCWLVALCAASFSHAFGGAPRVLPSDKLPADRRYEELRGVNSYHPFHKVESAAAWNERAQRLRRQLLVGSGLWPMPEKTPLKAVIHGRVERDDYTVERVFFEAVPGDFVTGSLYRPENRPAAKLPGVLCPHGHWHNGRFYENSEAGARREIVNGAERFVAAGRYPLQARCVQLARMGCVVFHYDMLGNADSVQLGFHRPSFREHLAGTKLGEWGFMSPAADARLQTVFGLQTLHSIRAVDFLRSLPEVDSERIAVTGASGGGTQSMILGAIDQRVAASFPCVMVSTAMQGGCTCENTHYLRVGDGNIDIAALTAPRPLGLTAADDWTVELETKGFPDLLALYKMLGHEDRVSALFATHFKHNYNHVSRTAMYNFINRHFQLGLESPVLERDFTPLSREEMTVWTDEHPAPEVTGELFERRLLQQMTEASDAQISALAPRDKESLARYHEIVGGAIQAMVGRTLPTADEIDFELVDKQQADGCLRMTGLVRNKTAGEELPTLFFYPKNWNGKVVLWVAPAGKSGVYQSSGELIDPVNRLIAAGTSVVAADLFSQGEFLGGENPPGERNRMIGYPSDGG